MKTIQVVTLKMVKEKQIMSEFSAINRPENAYNIMKEFIGDLDREMFVIAGLDIKNKINILHTVSIGTLSAAMVHPREVFKAALLSNSSTILLAHNHPSGDATPSREDINLTNDLIEAGKLLDIRILDHIILGDDTFVSFKDKGIM